MHGKKEDATLDEMPPSSETNLSCDIRILDDIS
jgi:hypothetical protein